MKKPKQQRPELPTSAALPAAAAHAEDAGPVDGDQEIARIMDEITAFIRAYIPAAEQEDFELAIWLYLETHPVMRERVQALRSIGVDRSGARPTEVAEKPAAPPLKLKGVKGGRGA